MDLPGCLYPPTSTPLVFLLFFDQRHYFSNACFYDVASLELYDTCIILYTVPQVGIYYTRTRTRYVYTVDLCMDT